MIRRELSRTLGWFFFRNFMIINVGFFLAALCYSLMFYKVYIVSDGFFRRRLLWFFGTGAFYCYAAGFLWHPIFNEWMQWALALPHVLAMIALTHYLVIGGGGLKK